MSRWLGSATSSSSLTPSTSLAHLPTSPSMFIQVRCTAQTLISNSDGLGSGSDAKDCDGAQVTLGMRPHGRVLVPALCWLPLARPFRRIWDVGELPVSRFQVWPPQVMGTTTCAGTITLDKECMLPLALQGSTSQILPPCSPQNCTPFTCAGGGRGARTAH